MIRWSDAKTNSRMSGISISTWIENRLDVLKAKEHIDNDRFMTTGQFNDFEIVREFGQWLQWLEFGVDL